MPALVTEPDPCFACSYGVGCRVERNVAASECESQLNAVGCAELLQSLGLLHAQFVCNRHLSKKCSRNGLDGQVPISQRGRVGRFPSVLPLQPICSLIGGLQRYITDVRRKLASENVRDSNNMER